MIEARDVHWFQCPWFTEKINLKKTALTHYINTPMVRMAQLLTLHSEAAGFRL